MKDKILCNDGAHRKLQISLFHILKEIDRLCLNNAIPYSLACGTLLGAVRHGGFIPWDDDADVYLLRDDFEKFIKIAKEQINPDFYIMNSDTHPNFIHAFTRVCLKNTTLTQNSYKDAGYHQGIFVDVFPLDTVTMDNDKLLNQLKRYERVARLKSVKAKVPASNPVKYFLKFLTRTALLPVTMKTLNKYTRKYASYYNEDSSEYVAYFTVNYYEILKRHALTKSNITNGIRIEFEGDAFSSVNNPKDYLTIEYGDYMRPPSIEKQVPSHEAIELIFNEKYTSF